MDIWEMRGYVLDCGKYTDDDFENDDFLFTLMTIEQLSQYDDEGEMFPFCKGIEEWIHRLYNILLSKYGLDIKEFKYIKKYYYKIKWVKLTNKIIRSIEPALQEEFKKYKI